jgi:predicted nucleotidyltransferase
VADLRNLPEVRRISVFGSYARGRRDLFTDLDILVVMETSEPILERLSRLYRLLDPGVDMDLIVWTPSEYERMRLRPFGRSIEASEVVLHER